MGSWKESPLMGANLFSTPLQHLERISNLLGIELWIKRDDLFPFVGGGNKARKISFILEQAEKEGCNALVTAGGTQSNHARVVALAAASRGWPCHLVIHSDSPNPFPLTGNALLMNLSGAYIQKVSTSEVASAMDQAMLRFQNEGLKPFYIWGGGHCVQGSYAYYEALKEVKQQLSECEHPQYIIVPSGTGTTQAGIEVGCCDFLPECRVLGISVARNQERGKRIILDCINELDNFLGDGRKRNEICFDDSWVGGGYEAVYSELIETINWAAKSEGIILDPTYTGKAFYALKQYVARQDIPIGSKVIFWHTGGLLNLLSSEKLGNRNALG